MTAARIIQIWFLFYLGILLQILFQARASIASRANSVTTFRLWLHFNWRDLSWRLLIDGLGFVGWMAGRHAFEGAAAHLIPPANSVIAPWIGFSVDRFTHSLGFILKFTTLDMTQIAPKEPK